MHEEKEYSPADNIFAAFSLDRVHLKTLEFLSVSLFLFFVRTAILKSPRTQHYSSRKGLEFIVRAFSIGGDNLY